MDRFEIGMAIVSRAGHDRGQLYMIVDIKDDFLYLADGRLKTLDHPKKKKKKHVQVIRRVYDIGGMDDAAVRTLIKEIRKEQTGGLG